MFPSKGISVTTAFVFKKKYCVPGRSDLYPIMKEKKRSEREN